MVRSAPMWSDVPTQSPPWGALWCARHPCGVMVKPYGRSTTRGTRSNRTGRDATIDGWYRDPYRPTLIAAAITVNVFTCFHLHAVP